MWATNDYRATMLAPATQTTCKDDEAVAHPEGHHNCETSTDPDTMDHPQNYRIPPLLHRRNPHYSHHQYHPHQNLEDSGTHREINDDPHQLSFPLHPHDQHHPHHHLYRHQDHDHLHHEASQLLQYHPDHPHYHRHQKQNQTPRRPPTTRTISRRSPSFKLTNSVWTICVSILLSLIFLSSHIGNGHGVAALSCAPCDLELCPDTSGCPGGLVIDICGCCQVCAKTENQSCGGSFGIRGKCDRNLQCFIRPETGKRITGSEEGICKEVKKEFRCEGAECSPDFEQLLCPKDSKLVTFTSDTKVFDNNVQRSAPLSSRSTPQNLTLHRHTRSTGDNNNSSSRSSNDDQGNNNNNEIENNDSHNNPVTKHTMTTDFKLPPDNPEWVETTPATSPPPPPPRPPAAASSSVLEEDDGDDKSEVVPDRTSYCVCDLTRCLMPVCAPGFTLHVAQNATGFPGSCCDTYTCNKTKGCDPVICPPLDETPCPDDSIRLPNIWTEDNCCELQQGCSCPSSDRCEPVRCPSGYQVQIMARTTGRPGACCDTFRCVNESGLTCRYDGREIKNGEKWNFDKCRSCVCKDGLNRCRDKTCGKLSCLWIVIPEDECCPICRGCVSESGNLYNNSDVWKENDCTTCKCVEGHVQCQAESCGSYCANPVKVPGQCCPVCPEEERTTKATALTPLVCPSLDTCSLECPEGLELSPHGCYMCKCKKGKCTLDCPYGLKADFEGNTLCECQAPEIVCPPWEEDQCDKKCEYGYRRNRDGCIKCKCNRCPPLNCTKRCLHGLLVNDEGCQICKCKEETIPELIGLPKVEDGTSDPEHKDDAKVNDLSCLSMKGIHHENGESWNDGCRVCYCHKGVEMCSLIACPAPLCSNPVFRLEDCCPSCPGLTIPSPNGDKLLCQSTTGDYYVEGQTWKMDPCTRCVCHGGSILCESMSCPPVLCHRPVKPENQCCPVCKGEDFSLLPPSPMRRRCKSPSGMWYKHREVWRSTPCQTCVCQDGQFHCYNQMCAPLKCNKTLLRKDQCCPTCAEPETENPKICSYNNEVYDSDEKWEGDNCTQCLCSNGRVHCFPLTCPALKCSVMVKKRGQCCPTCYDVPIQGTDSHDKHNNTTASSVTEGDGGPNYVGMIILGVILLIFACVIVYLAYRLYLRRQKQTFRDTCAASNDELQGQTFLPPSDTKNIDIDIKQPALEKLYYSSLADKGTDERAFNTYTDLNFDKNKNNAPIYKGC